jgi:NAD(P)-dependent dehydrogenase (short-subunit alcohol dehydrogenase family)
VALVTGGTDGARTETADGFEMIASEAHRRARGGLDFDDLMMAEGRFRPTLAYNRSKLANILYAREYARRLEGSGVDVVAAHPGAVDTPMTRALIDYPVLRNLYLLFRRGLISPDDAAGGLLRVALAPSQADARGPSPKS